MKSLNQNRKGVSGGRAVRPHRLYRNEMKRRGCLILLMAFALVLVMTSLEGYRGVVRFIGQETTATVIEYRQDPPGRMREGDWIMKYVFVTESGEETFSETTFAPKDRPRDSVTTIQVLYLSGHPGISEVKGYVSITGLMGYLFAVFAVWQAIPFLRTPNNLHEDKANPNDGKGRVVQ